MTEPISITPSTGPRDFGDYALLRQLGRGGMGQVFLARVRAKGLTGVDKLCVVKTLHATNDPEYERRFVDEARLIVLLAHKNICHVFDAGCYEGQYYLAMEHINGRELRDLQKLCEMHHAPLPVDVGIFIIKEVLEALDAAHRMAHPISGEPLRVVHRDVSPQNVMLSSEGEVKLIDFGLAESSQKIERTAPRIVMGKIAYMGPEQARGDPGLDGRADQFAVGVMLYELLSNGRYYGDLAFDDVWRMSGRGGHTPPLLHTLDPGLQAIIKKATAPNRDDRYASCGDMRAALQKVELARGALGGSRETRAAMQALLNLAGETLPSLSSPEMKALLAKPTSPAQPWPPAPPAATPQPSPAEAPPTTVIAPIAPIDNDVTVVRHDKTTSQTAHGSEPSSEPPREKTRTFRIRAVTTDAPGIENLAPTEKTEIGFVIEGLEPGAVPALKTGDAFRAVSLVASSPSAAAPMPPPTSPAPTVEIKRIDLSAAEAEPSEPTQLVRPRSTPAPAPSTSPAPQKAATQTISTPAPMPGVQLSPMPELADDELAATRRPRAMIAAIAVLAVVAVAIGAVALGGNSGTAVVVDAGVTVVDVAVDAGAAVVAVPVVVDAGAVVVDAGAVVVDAGAADVVVDAGVPVVVDAGVAAVVDAGPKKKKPNKKPEKPEKPEKPDPPPPEPTKRARVLPELPHGPLPRARFVQDHCADLPCAKALLDASKSGTLEPADYRAHIERCIVTCRASP